MEINQLLSLNYLLEKYPQTDFLWGFPLLAFFLLVIFLPSITKNFAKKNKYLKKSIRKKLWPFLILGVIGEILVLSRFAEFILFSRRIFLLLWIILTFIASLVIFLLVNKQYQKRIKSVAREKEKS